MTSDVWNITVDSSLTVPNSTFMDNTHYCGYWCNHSTGYNWITTSYYPTTVYMYQIKCPTCEKMNWAQLDVTVDCKTPKCKAKLRAVTAKAIEVEVEV